MLAQAACWSWACEGDGSLIITGLSFVIRGVCECGLKDGELVFFPCLLSDYSPEISTVSVLKKCLSEPWSQEEGVSIILVMYLRVQKVSTTPPECVPGNSWNLSLWKWHDCSKDGGDTGRAEFDVLSKNSSSLHKKCNRNFFLLTPCIPSPLIIKVFARKCCGDTMLLKRK